MGNVPVHDVDHEIIGGIAIAALSYENKIPRPVEARAGESLARDQKVGPGQRHTTSGLARSLRIGSVGKNLLLMIVLFAAMPAGSRPARGGAMICVLVSIFMSPP